MPHKFHPCHVSSPPPYSQLNSKGFAGNFDNLMQTMTESAMTIREDFKYYFADFVRKGGGGYPPNP